MSAFDELEVVEQILSTYADDDGIISFAISLFLSYGSILYCLALSCVYSM